MTWIPLLLADPSPLLRRQVLKELLGRSNDDPEVKELTDLGQADPLVVRLLAGQQADGSWQKGLSGDTSASTPVLATALALMRLAYLGLAADHPEVRKAAEFLFSCQNKEGAWPLPQVREDGEGREGYSMIPLQTAIPLRGLAACGYAQDPRAERAYEWLLERRLPDGAWPTGRASGVNGYVAGYRRIAHSRWGCRSNTTGALLCLALHPVRCSGPEARRALDLILGRETHEGWSLGTEVARLVGAQPYHGFLTFFARFDLAQVLDLCRRVGLTTGDERVADLIAFIRELQGPYGLWEYAQSPQVNRWLTWDILRSLLPLEGSEGREEDWISLEPRTPFQAYPRKQKRY